MLEVEVVEGQQDVELAGDLLGGIGDGAELVGKASETRIRREELAGALGPLLGSDRKTTLAPRGGGLPAALGLKASCTSLALAGTTTATSWPGGGADWLKVSDANEPPDEALFAPLVMVLGPAPWSSSGGGNSPKGPCLRSPSGHVRSRCSKDPRRPPLQEASRPSFPPIRDLRTEISCCRGPARPVLLVTWSLPPLSPTWRSI